jgi:L-threonylcarbamoyladenylate synthase
MKQPPQSNPVAFTGSLQNDLRQAQVALQNAGVVLLPTETCFGLAADPRSSEAIDKIFRMKGRPKTMALPLVAADLNQVLLVAPDLPNELASLAQKYWPGPLTLILKSNGVVHPSVTAQEDTIAIRVTSGVVARDLCKQFGFPLIATSANLSGQPSPTYRADVSAHVSEAVDFEIPPFEESISTISSAVGEQPPRVSTIVQYNAESKQIEIVRQGVLRL